MEYTAVESSHGHWTEKRGQIKAHPDTKPGALRARAAEFKPQLYNLSEDPGEKNDLIDKYPNTAKRLESLLNQLRKQGYGRLRPLKRCGLDD